jgi:carbon-monoxide dehydrogenase large subunit
MTGENKWVGRSVHRVEDLNLITGAGSYVGDVHVDGQLWARVVRSSSAHAKLLSVDVTPALGCPGVVAAFSAADLGEFTSARIPCRMAAPPKGSPALQPPFAIDRVRYVGEPVAVVVGEDPYVVEDAAGEVVVEYEELPPVIDLRSAAAEGSVTIHPELGGNIVDTREVLAGSPIDELFLQADVVVSDMFTMHRHSAVPMETRGLLATVDAHDRLTLYGPTKVKHFNRGVLANLLKRPVESIRFVECDVGGGFGARGEFYPEDFLVPWLALKLRRPVKWVEDRAENLVAMNHSRECIFEISVAADRDGRLLALRNESWFSMGAYVRTTGVGVPEISQRNLSGPYLWQGLQSVAHAVITNKTPLGTFRGPGESEATYARERIIDELCRRLEMDPLDLRRRNLIRREQLPYVAVPSEDIVYDDGDFPVQLDTLADKMGYAQLREDSEQRRADGEAVGVGVACFMNEAAYGPFEWARIVAEPDGRFTGYVGVASVGQGLRTALSQVLADALGVDIDRIAISHHDTDEVLEGMGAYADRGAAMGGSALVVAAERLADEARRLGAEKLGVPEDQLRVVEGQVTDGVRTIDLGDLGCSVEARFERPGMEWAFTAVIAVASVDVDTGKVKVEKFLGAHDSGTVVNPMIVAGQLNGASAQGIAGTLYEEYRYDEDGQPLSTSFMDYVIPTCAEMADEVSWITMETAAIGNPVGAKGVGCPGTVGAYGAIANAVVDALTPFGIEVRDLPLRPNNVRAALRAATAGSDAGGPVR